MSVGKCIKHDHISLTCCSSESFPRYNRHYSSEQESHKPHNECISSVHMNTLSSLELNAHRSCSSALEFIRSNSGDGGTPTALVGYPVQRVFGRILTIAPKTTPANKQKVFITNRGI
jgi:hypothetical protein